MQYATQYRKLKDTCYLVTQSVEHVHVQVRRLGQQFNYIRNERKETFKGFRRTVYLVPPSSDAAIAIDSNTFRLDVSGLASCYFTAGGVGISAIGTGDGGSRKRGLNLNWIWAMCVAALIAAVAFLKYGSDFAVRKLVGETVGRKTGKVSSEILVGKDRIPSEKPDDQSRLFSEPVIYDAYLQRGGVLYVCVKRHWYRVGGRTGSGMLFLEDGHCAVARSEDARVPAPQACVLADNMPQIAIAAP